MKSKVFLFLVSVAALLTGCNKADVDIQSGSGSMTYDGATYSFDLSTLITSPSGDKYKHNVTFSNKGDGNVTFNFSVKDDNSQNGISAGDYQTTSAGGDCTAHFSINETTAGDYLMGTMNISVSGDKYTFNFTGTTIDENTETKMVEFTYTGKIVH